jgi:hypothetical protein
MEINCKVYKVCSGWQGGKSWRVDYDPSVISTMHQTKDEAILHALEYCGPREITPFLQDENNAILLYPIM